jgi:hypothetical protein
MERIMTHFAVDDSGNQDFHHEGWQVRIWGEEHAWRRIEVTTPSDSTDVVVDEDGLWVNGVSSGTWCDGPQAFTIPWPVIEAIIEARATVG